MANVRGDQDPCTLGSPYLGKFIFTCGLKIEPKLCGVFHVSLERSLVLGLAYVRFTQFPLSQHI